MSTLDVPGYKAEHNDTLAMGCWAEHDDGSLLLVERITEAGKVEYSIIDRSSDPVTEYWGSMPEGLFKRSFSHGGPVGLGWVWHDKSPWPMERATVPVKLLEAPRSIAAESVDRLERMAYPVRVAA